MDINSLLSPSETPRSKSLTPGTPAQSPFSHVQRSQSGSGKPGAGASPLSRAIQPPSTIPAHIRSPSQAPSHSSPLISPVPTAIIPQNRRTSSTHSMEALADLALMQNHLSTPPQLKSRDSNESQKSVSLLQSQVTSNPRASFDISMVEPPKQRLRDDFAGSSLPISSQQRLTDLVCYVRENPSAYDSHIEIIKILHQGFVDHIYPSSSPNARGDPTTYDLLEELRQAREGMDQLFAVGEEQWLDWLQDESILAQSAEERVAVVEKCRRAVEEEHGSSRLWSTYADWVFHCHNWAHESTSEGVPDTERLIGQELFKWDGVLQVWEQALDQTKDDLGQSHLVWDKYIRSRFPNVDQKMPTESAEQAMEAFQSRLRVPHSQWDQTFQLFSSFVSANYSDGDYENIMALTLRNSSDAKSIWAAREQHENALSEASRSGNSYQEYQAFIAYVEWEKSEERAKQRKSKGKRKQLESDLVQALFHRAELRTPSIAALWEDHIEFINERRKPAVLDVLYRATKHCPWSGSLWKQYLMASELADETYQETESIKHNATKTGMLDAAGIEDVLRVHDAWCGYLLRRTRRTDATEEDADVAEMGIRTSMETVQSLATKLHLPSDFDTFFRLQRKYVEYLKGQGRLDNARKQFDDSISIYGKHYRFWLRFYEFEMQKSIHIASLQQDARDGVSSISSAPFAVAILKQGLDQPDLDYPEYLIETLESHCEDYEDGEELQSALLLIGKARKAITLRRQKEAAEAAEATETPVEAMTNGVSAGKRKRDEVDEGESNKRIRSEDATQDSIEPMTEDPPKRDREHASILVQNLPVDISETRIRQYFTTCGTVQNIGKVQDHSVVVEFQGAEEAEYALSRDGQDFEGSTLSVMLNTGSTLYVTNYPPIADEAYIRDLFQSYGEIVNVRFPSLQGNKNRRFCYVELKSPKDAQTALELDGNDIEGLQLMVKISDPTNRKTRLERKADGRTVFVGQLPFKATDEEIESAFSSFGTIESMKVPRDKSKNKGIAFLTFVDSEAASKALDMNGKPFQGRTLKVNIASQQRASDTKSPTPHVNGDAPSPQNSQKSVGRLAAADIEERRQRTIAISDIPDTVNESRLRALAQKAGSVVKVILKTNHQGALVEFETAAAAGRGAIELDGHEIDPGRKIRVTTEHEMLQQKPEKKDSRIDKPLPPKTAPNVPIRRPVQPGAKRGGHLGHRVRKVFKSNEGDQPNGEETEKKSNADFRAMIAKS